MTELAAHHQQAHKTCIGGEMGKIRLDGRRSGQVELLVKVDYTQVNEAGGKSVDFVIEC